jgi:hypothetical protein
MPPLHGQLETYSIPESVQPPTMHASAERTSESSHLAKAWIGHPPRLKIIRLADALPTQVCYTLTCGQIVRAGPGRCTARRISGRESGVS